MINLKLAERASNNMQKNLASGGYRILRHRRVVSVVYAARVVKHSNSPISDNDTPARD